jgi:hypothetical protein
MIKLNSCVYTSFLFLCNSFLCYQYNYLLYSKLLFSLFITSIIYHSNRNNITKYIDMFLVGIIIIYSSNIFINKIQYSNKHGIIFFILFCYLLMAHLYIYGYYIDDYCHNKDYDKANMYHSMLHISGSIGILFLTIL